MKRAKRENRQAGTGHRGSIRSKIMLRMSLTVLISLLISGIISAVLNYTSTVSLLETTMAETAILAAERVAYELDSYENIAWELGSLTRLANPDTPVEEKREIINQRVESHNFVRGDLIGSDGRSIFSGNEYLDRTYFQEAMQGRTHISDPVLSRTTGDLTIVVAAPLWENGVPNTRVVGVVYMVPPTTFLNDIMDTIRVSVNSGAFVINREGTTIAHEDASVVASEFNVIQQAQNDPSLVSLAELERDAVEGNSGFGSYTYQGIRRFLSYAPIRGTAGWSIAINARTSDFMRSVTVSIITIVILTVVASLLAMLLAWRFARSIGNPLTACAQRLQRLSEGDLHSPVPDIHTDDEVELLVRTASTLQSNTRDIIADIGHMMEQMSAGNFAVRSSNRSAYQGDYQQILESMDSLLQNVSRTMSRINGAAQQVDNSSDQVAQSASALSDGAVHQASSIEELAASINEISGYVRETDRITTEAKRRMAETNAMTLRCNEQMQEMLLAMHDISRASEEIGKIIKAIEDIAFQTNILALNAAVEAARAGASGKGFAVVADEVRNLAAKSAEASQSTATLIDTAAAAVQRGVDLANSTASQLQKVSDASQDIDRMVGRIADSAGNQAQSIEQVTVGIDQISSVIQNNSATAEQSAAASQELAGQATFLKQQISQFRLAP